MTDAPKDSGANPPPVPGRRLPWLFPAIRVAFLVAAGSAAWYIAGNWDRLTGEARFEATDDAYTAGDLTPLSAKISGYVARVAVNDYQAVHQGELLVEIDPADYRAQLALANANLAAAEAALANIANQKDVQRALIRQAEATIAGTKADLERYRLEDARQIDLLKTNLAGTRQNVEQANANDQRTQAQLQLNEAQLDQQKSLLDALDTQEKQLAAQVLAARADVDLATDNLGYTRIMAPVDGLVGQRQVRAGQFVNPGTQVIAVLPLATLWVTANYKETQMTHVRVGQPARVTVDAFPDLVLTGRVDSWSPGTGSTFALLPPDNATGNFTKVVQRVPVKITLDANPYLGTLLRAGMSVETRIDTGATPPP
jgi:membrane fusion protein (multidrug efflux system)